MSVDIISHTKKKVESALTGCRVDIIDQSAGHVGHGASGAHIAMRVTWDGFKGKTMIEQHRMVFDLLKEEMKEQIHALALDTKVE